MDTIVVAGAWTNFSVEHTARHGADAGYRAVVLTDGTSTINDEWHNAGLKLRAREHRRARHLRRGRRGAGGLRHDPARPDHGLYPPPHLTPALSAPRGGEGEQAAHGAWDVSGTAQRPGRRDRAGAPIGA